MTKFNKIDENWDLLEHNNIKTEMTKLNQNMD